MTAQARIVAVLGAACTGRTWLVQALATHVATRPGWSATDVGRVPDVPAPPTDRPGAHDSAAAEHAWRLAEAAARHRLVFADGTAVSVAVRARFATGDRSFEAAALAAHRAVDVTLLTALDLPWVSSAHRRDGPHTREPVDRLLRALLNDGGVPFTVVHGQGPQRLRAALRALSPAFRSWGFDTLADDAAIASAPAAASAPGFRFPLPGDDRGEDSGEDSGDTGAGTPSSTRRWMPRCACCGDPDGEADELRRLRSRRPRP